MTQIMEFPKEIEKYFMVAKLPWKCILEEESRLKQQQRVAKQCKLVAGIEVGMLHVYFRASPTEHDRRPLAGRFPWQNKGYSQWLVTSVETWTNKNPMGGAWVKENLSVPTGPSTVLNYWIRYEKIWP